LKDRSIQRAAETAISRAKVAEEVAKAKSLFFANVGNDLKTPLNQIIGYSELLKETAFDKGRHDEISDIDRVLEAASRLSSMLNQMLAISLDDSRRCVSDINTFDLPELVDDATARLKSILHAATTRVCLALEGAPQTWIGDKQKLDQCLRSVLLIWSATRSACAMMVSAGFTAADDGKNDASTTNRFSTSCVRQNGSSTDVFGSAPKHNVPHWWVVLRLLCECVITIQKPRRFRMRVVSLTSRAWARTLFGR